jgi:NAD(P)-dependent dehydrogenase (short-subunit alcohol dehydrogenase family)
MGQKSMSPHWHAHKEDRMRRFDGKVALITGAASGLGRASCKRLAAEGARVFGLDLDSTGLAAVAESINAAGGTMQTGHCDVSDPASCAAGVEAAVRAFDRLDILCNSAGVNRFHNFVEMPTEDWQLIIGVNLTGTALMCRSALPHLLEAGGNIVNVASVAGLKGQAYTAAYCASKGGVIQLTRSLAMEYIDRGIRVNAVAPGGVDTPMTEGIHFPEDTNWELVKPYIGRRGLATAEQIADAIAYLASDDASVVHGVILPVDHGITAG